MLDGFIQESCLIIISQHFTRLQTILIIFELFIEMRLLALCLTSNLLYGPCPLTSLAWVTISEAHASTSIAFQVIRASRPLHQVNILAFRKDFKFNFVNSWTQRVSNIIPFAFSGVMFSSVHSHPSPWSQLSKGYGDFNPSWTCFVVIEYFHCEPLIQGCRLTTFKCT
jgi:hypothetical protein